VRDLAILVIQLIMMIARFFGPGDARSIVTESPLVIRGAPRTHGELLKPGIQIPGATVSKGMIYHRRSPWQKRCAERSIGSIPRGMP
jgi:hypothetical protein